MSGPFLRYYGAFLLLFIGIVYPRSCWGFGPLVGPYRQLGLQWKPQHFHSHPSKGGADRCPILFSHFKAADDITVNNLQGGSPFPEQKVPIWLDLRGTALLPREAVDYICDNIGTETADIIGRVIVSEKIMEKLVLQPTEQDSFLFVPSQGDDLVFSCKDSQQSLPCGKVIRQQEGVLFNPVLALDIVMTNGGWVLMDQNMENDESVWLEEVSSLMTFLLSSSSATARLDLNKGLDGVRFALEGPPKPTMYSTPAGNGLAVACSSGRVLMEVSKAIMTLTSLPGGSLMSSGGILLPKGGTSSSIRIPSEGEWSIKAQLPVAIVLPLDVGLWETAIDLLVDTDR